jgi:uncharacterized damage-inducible protein DinB
MQNALVELFERDLRKLEREILAYQKEKNLWLLSKAIRNSAGNLAIHICGNLQYYIGTVLGKTGYLRNRDNEFSIKDVKRETIIEEIQNTQNVVERVLSNLTHDTLITKYPQQVLGFEMTTEYFLIHLFGHLSYHLGQINYHRRLLDN